MLPLLLLSALSNWYPEMHNYYGPHWQHVEMLCPVFLVPYYMFIIYSCVVDGMVVACISNSNLCKFESVPISYSIQYTEVPIQSSS